jgi:hypothetical protein
MLNRVADMHIQQQPFWISAGHNQVQEIKLFYRQRSQYCR